MDSASAVSLHTTRDLESLPDATSPTLHLSHPTPNESFQIWQQTARDWKDSLTIPEYLEEYAYLVTVPLARNNGITPWILIDKNQPVNNRTILASCETFRKRALINNTNTNEACSDVIAHGVASVYCEARLRNRGYASRLLKELSKILPSWQTNDKTSIASMLYSDIDPKFYHRLGWNPFPSYHIEFKPSAEMVHVHSASSLHAEDLATLCEEDEALLRKSMSEPSPDSGTKPRFAIIPDHDHLVWHHSKEEFGAQKLFGGKTPGVKGAMAGPSGNRVWAIWTHRFYQHPEVHSSVNTLYILRFVMEGAAPAAEAVRAVLQAAQGEAAQWGLHSVKLWSPAKGVEELIEAAGVPFERRTRTQDSIPCLQWYGEDDGTPNSIDWVLNEKYAWC